MPRVGRGSVGFMTCPSRIVRCAIDRLQAQINRVPFATGQFPPLPKALLENNAQLHENDVKSYRFKSWAR